MNCVWYSKTDGLCEREATEQWTELPQWDHYGGWENSMGKPLNIYHYCDIHIARIITIWTKSYGNAIIAEKKLKTIYTIERL